MHTLEIPAPDDVREFLRMPPLAKIVGFERRRFDQLNTRFKAKISSDDEKAYCDVLDMSEGGARIRPHSYIDVPMATLHVLGIGSWYGDVMWRSDGEIGMRFHNRVDAFTLSTML